MRHCLLLATILLATVAFARPLPGPFVVNDALTFHLVNPTGQDVSRSKYSGRSAYLCRDAKCLEIALKTTKLKQALEGRKRKGVPSWRKIPWPLEAQLIHSMRTECTDQLKTCQNTESYGEG